MGGTVTMLTRLMISIAFYFSRSWVVECWLPANLNDRNTHTGEKFVRKKSSITTLPVASVVSFSAALQLLLVGITVLPAEASEDFFFQNQISPRQERVLKDIKDLKTLQDSRLDICVERGRDWENCFLFGDSAFDMKKKEVAAGGSAVAARNEVIVKHQRPPTW
mmetsp:Transcript_5400/g.8022  ORF Transcript_5400/g.8022 Transcript_5400/m.8022 type:complete len:164 (+) Transcript_5400:267-758(+)